MEDLFEREQKILDHALAQLARLGEGELCPADEYAVIVEEYRKLLKQLRRIIRISDQTTVELNSSNLDLQDKVHFDALTGIYNRRFLDEQLGRILHSLAYDDGLLSVLMVDVDFFKRYNDTYGHGKGDECLRTIAQTVNQCTLRTKDFTARYGGEEFIVILQNTDQYGAQAIANRILDSIRACGIPHAENDAAEYVTVSIGITTGEVKPAHTMIDYIKSADKALYLSKRNGRNKSTFVKLKEEL